jgi:predicted membrane protein
MEMPTTICFKCPNPITYQPRCYFPMQWCNFLFRFSLLANLILLTITKTMEMMYAYTVFRYQKWFHHASLHKFQKNKLKKIWMGIEHTTRQKSHLDSIRVMNGVFNTHQIIKWEQF